MQVRIARPHDASAIVSTIETCYGSTYIEFEALDVQRLENRLISKATIYALAEDAGRVVGQVALERLGSGLYAHCRAVVDLEWRGRGLMSAMSEVLLGPVARELGVQVALGSSVTQHVATQAYNLRAGFVPLGLLLGIYPGIQAAGVPSPEEQEAVSGFQMGLSLDPDQRTRRLHLPARLHDPVARVLDALRMPHRQPRRAPRERELGVEVRRHEASGRVMLAYSRGVAGAPPTGAWLEREVAAGAGTFWADLPLEEPITPRLCDRLADLGFSYGAVVPLAGPLGEDVLRLQRCERPLTRERIRALPALESLRDYVWAEQQSLVAISG